MHRPHILVQAVKIHPTHPKGSRALAFMSCRMKRAGCCEHGRAPINAALTSIPWHPSRLVSLRVRAGLRRLSLDWDRSLLVLNFFSRQLALKKEFSTMHSPNSPENYFLLDDQSVIFLMFH
ncbi:unnamed protein product [Ectocarpus sp. 13 AM-2016]